ncbi:MAG: cytochrome c oxidase subunit II [Methylobacter sp.]
MTCSLASRVPISILFFLAGCNGPQSALNPAGPSAHAVAKLWWAMFGFSALVLLVIVALWLFAIWRKPKPLTDKEAGRLSLRWIIGGGFVLPVVSLTVLLGFGIPMGYRMLPLPLTGETLLRIDVTGHQWWWEVRYPDAGIVLKNELHLPAGVPVDIHVTSSDVIHSFWVPRLAGKLDMIPGRTNILRLQADAPGHFRGQCAEFCGTGHAGMVLAVQAHTPKDFQAWLEANTHE